MLEFVIAAPVILTVLIAIMVFGNALYAYNLVTNAARLGTRYAAVRGADCSFADCPATTTSVQNYVRSVSPNIVASSLTVTTTWSAGTQDACTVAPYQSPGCLVTVQTSYPYLAIGPFTLMTLSSSSQMYISH